MAPPVYSIKGNAIDMSVNQSLVGGNISYGSVTASSLRINITTSGAKVSQSTPYSSQDFSSSPLDLSTGYLFIRILTGNRIAGGGLEFRDSAGNYKRFYGPRYIETSNTYYSFDLNSTTTAESGTLDSTDIVEIRYLVSAWPGSSSGKYVSFINFYHMDGILASGGEVANPVKFSSIYDFFDGSAITTTRTIGPESTKAKIDEFIRFQHSLIIGDNDATYIDPEISGAFLFPPNYDGPFNLWVDSPSATRGDRNGNFLSEVSRNLIFNTTLNQTFTGKIIERCNVTDLSSGTISFNSISFLSCLAIAFGSNSIVTGGQSISATSVTGGASVTGHIFDDSYYVWNGTTTLSNNTFQNESSLGALQIASDITLNNFVFSNNTYDFYVNAPSGTITITVDAASATDHSGGFNDAGYIAAKVNSAGATVVIETPPVSFNATSLTTTTFNNVRTRLSQVIGGPVQLNNNGTVASGGINFTTGNINITNNTITLTGIANKLNFNSVIRFYGSDLPSPIDSRAVYYPSTDYVFTSDNLTISSTPGGTTIDLINVGSGSDMYASPWTELNISLITSGDYTVDLQSAAATASVTLESGDILVLQAIHHDAPGTGGSANISNYLEQSFQYSEQSITSLATLSLASNPMALLAEIGLDGSQVIGYSFDVNTPGKVQIDISKTSPDTRELVAFYYYTQWLEAGLRLVRGNISVDNLNSISIRGELTFDAASRSVMSGPYTYRLDEENIVAPESEQISFNWQDTRAAVVQTEVAVDLPIQVLQAIQSILFNTSRIPNISGNQTAIITRLAGIEGSGFDTATDSLEALRDRGDTAWTTATGFSTHGPPDLSNLDVPVSSRLADSNYTAPDNAGIAAIPTNPLLATDARLNNLNAPISDIPTNPLTALPAIPMDWITADGIATNAIAKIQNGLSTFDPGATPVTVGTNQDKSGYSLTQAFPANFAAFGISASGHISRVTLVDTTTANTDMRGTDGALTSFSGLPNVTVGGYAAGQAPNELIDISNLALEASVQSCLSAATAFADGRFINNYSASTATQYNTNGSVRTVFDLYQADGTTLATTAQDAVERRPQ